jgi:hypothetical protein
MVILPTNLSTKTCQNVSTVNSTKERNRFEALRNANETDASGGDRGEFGVGEVDGWHYCLALTAFAQPTVGC